jgi:hypothetical protein
MLIPQALMAVCAVALLYGAVTRISGPRTALLAGTALVSSSAAGLELASGTAVLAIGEFTGTDPTPTLAQFQDDVAQHKVA